MLARRLIAFAACVALALFCPGCALAPDRWTLTARDQEEARTGRWRVVEVDAQLSGPIPTFAHD